MASDRVADKRLGRSLPFSVRAWISANPGPGDLESGPDLEGGRSNEEWMNDAKEREREAMRDCFPTASDG